MTTTPPISRQATQSLTGRPSVPLSVYSRTVQIAPGTLPDWTIEI